MKFANVHGIRTEATKAATGHCPICESELVARCGEVNVNHWAHKGNRNCDSWSENETAWHRSWKNCFPIDWQEVVQFDEKGEKHIADVMTPAGFVLEIQHSYLNPEERRARNAFYKKLVWVVDGTRRKTDIAQFQKAVEESTIVWKEPLIRRVHFPEEVRLLKEWHGSNALVFFDFQGTDDKTQPKLWFLFPAISASQAYLSIFSRESFIERHNDNKFGEIVSNVILPIREILAENIKRSRNQSQRLPKFAQNATNLRRRRRPL
jgi:competence protein CoiA